MVWDDLRFFLELARAGRLTIAARRLGVEHTTVARRIQALERETGTVLFTRTPNGYELSAAGEKVLPVAQAMADAFSSTSQVFPHSPDPMDGLVRIGANEGYGTVVLPRHVAGLVTEHPSLSIEILALPRAIPLPRQEADIVISIDRAERGPYKIVRLAEYRLGLYASESYLDRYRPIRSRDDLKGHTYIDYIEELALAKNVPTPSSITQPGVVPIRSTSILAQRTVAESGMGLAILPCYLVPSSSCLRSVLADEISFTRTYWMMSQIDLLNTSRVRATWDYLHEAATSDRHLFLRN